MQMPVLMVVLAPHSVSLQSPCHGSRSIASAIAIELRRLFEVNRHITPTERTAAHTRYCNYGFNFIRFRILMDFVVVYMYVTHFTVGSRSFQNACKRFHGSLCHSVLNIQIRKSMNKERKGGRKDNPEKILCSPP